MAVFKRLFGKRAPKRVLGLDIGSDAARLAMLRRDGDTTHLEWVEEVSLREMQGFTDYDAVLEKLAPILEERKVRNVEVAADPPWNSARVVLEEMPSMSTDRFYKAADFYFQQKDNEALLDPLHHAIPQPVRTTLDESQVIDGLMVSMDRVMVRGLDEMCEKMDLRLSWIAAQPLCYQQLLRGPGTADKNLFVADIGASQTRLYLMVQGKVLLIRRLKPCANDIVKALGDEFQLPWEDAVNALRGHSGAGPLAEDDPEGILATTAKTVERELDTLSRHLADEVQRSTAYVATRQQEDVDGILVCGGVVESPTFLESLDQRIHLPLTVLNPFAHLEVHAEVPESKRARYSLAIGAAQQRISAPEEHNILMAGKIALADPEGSESRWDGLRRYALAGGAAAVVLGVGSYEAVMASRQAGQQESLGRLQEALEEAEEYAEALGYNHELFQLDDQIAALRELYDARQLHTPYVARMVSLLPADTWLTEITLQESDGSLEEYEASAAEELAGEIDLEYEDEDGDDHIGDLLDEAYGEDDSDPAAPLGMELRLTGRALRVESIGHLVLTLEQEGLLSAVQTLHVRDEVLGEADDANAQRVHRFTLVGRPDLHATTSPALSLGGSAR